MEYSKKEQLTIVQEKVHDEFTNYLTSIVGLKAPHHQTESLERRVQIFIRECMNADFTCVYDCQDAEFLKMVIEKIRNHKDWSKYNKRHAGTLTSSLNHYIAYLGYIGHKIPDVKDPDEYKEGRVSYVHAVGYERNQDARKACIAHYGYKCAICGFDFEKVYGEIGRDFIEVHHIIPIHERKGEYAVNPITDLRPLCSNCHSMVHRRNPVYKIEEIMKFITDSTNG